MSISKFTANKYSCFVCENNKIMPSTCCIFGCNSRGCAGSARKFFAFPMLNNQSEKQLAITQARQKAWFAAINRTDFFASHFQYARVCDLHFVSGRSVKYTNVDHPDWVPTLNLGYEMLVDESTETLPNQSLHESLVAEHLDSTNSTDKSNTDLFEGGVFDVNTKSSQTFVPINSTGTQTNALITGVSVEIVLSYQEQIKLLQEMLAIHNVSLDNFRGNDKKTKFFTGITNFATLEALYEMMQPRIKFTKKLTSFQILIIVLSRLRLNLSFRYLSYQFNVSITTISRHFYRCLQQLHLKLRKFVYFPDRESIKKTTPLVFQRSFGKSIVTVIDCFEIFIERPGNQKALAQCYSSYKHAYTVKYLIGITPQGFIAFISKGFGGRCSDKFVTEKSGFLDKLNIGDVVMADRGFLIEDELKRRHVELNIPAFTKGINQLHPRDIESTRKIANTRIHVERIIGQLRQKFTILHQFKFPISLIKKTTSTVNTIDQILTVCSALSNLCSPIVCKSVENL